MSDSTKCMPDDGAVQRIASHDPANLYISGARTKAMAVEILRLRSELEKAQAEVKRLEAERAKPAPFSQCSDGWGYAISSIGWDDIKMPYRISIRRTHQDGREEVLDFVEPHRFLASKKQKEAEPPADVLGGAFRKAMHDAVTGAYLCNLRRFGDAMCEAVTQLAAAFERHVRGGGE